MRLRRNSRIVITISASTNAAASIVNNQYNSRRSTNFDARKALSSLLASVAVTGGKATAIGWLASR